MTGGYRLTFTAMTVLALLLASCGASSGRDELVAAISESYQENLSGQEGAGIELSNQEANCAASAMVDAVGYDRLVDAGVTPESVRSDSLDSLMETDLFGRQELEASFDGIFDCIDLVDAMAPGMAEDMAISQESAECIVNGLAESGAFREMLVVSALTDDSTEVGGDAAIFGALFELMGECLDEDEGGAFFGGTGSESSGEGQAEPTACAGPGPSKVTVDASQLDQLFGFPALSGEVTIEILSTERLPETFESPFFGVIGPPQGEFFGVRYRVANDANAELQPATHVSDDLRLTDGGRSWGVADYQGPHMSVSTDWSAVQGDDQDASMVGAGFETTTWAVFDIPTDAEPTGLALELSGGQTCLAFP